MTHDDNPYAAPKADLVVKDPHLLSSDDAWRDGKMLVLRNGAELTDRCLKCAAPTTPYRDWFSRSLSWHRPFWYVTVISPIIYILVYLLVRYKARVTVALCPLHRKKRTRAIALAWLTALSGIGMIIALASFSDVGKLSPTYHVAGNWVGALLIFGGIVGGMLGSQVLVPTRMNTNFVWLGKVAPSYLATLPEWDA